jgi:hypothetical protein
MLARLKYFLWLVYAAAALQLIVSLLPDKSRGDLITFVVVAVIILALAWAAAHGKAKYAVWLLFAFFVFDTINTIGELWGEGASWLQRSLAPDRPVAGLQITLDVLTNLFEFGALYFYFTVKPAQ